MHSEDRQAAHYDKHLSEYNSHYDDEFSQRYRTRFIYRYLFHGMNLRGLKVLEAMCGSGLTTGYLLSAGSEVTGLDISPAAISSFKRRWPDCSAVCGSILDTKFDDASFDCVVIVGGLHHVHPNVNKAVGEIHRILKRGGYLCFFEPHMGSFPDMIRRFWYRHDKFFLSNEVAIDLERMKVEFASRFVVTKEKYGGNIAYLLVLNSLIFRIPLRLKSFYSSVLSGIEAAAEKLIRKRSGCFVICQWRKNANQ